MTRFTAPESATRNTSPNSLIASAPGLRRTTANTESTITGPPKYTGSMTFAEGAWRGNSVSSFRSVARFRMKPRCSSPTGTAIRAVWLYRPCSAGEAASSTGLPGDWAWAAPAASSRKKAMTRFIGFQRSVERAREGTAAQFVRSFGLLVDELEQRDRNFTGQALRRPVRRGRDVGEVQAWLERSRNPVLAEAIGILHRESAKLRAGCKDFADGGVDAFHRCTFLA